MSDHKFEKSSTPRSKTKPKTKQKNDNFLFNHAFSTYLFIFIQKSYDDVK